MVQETPGLLPEIGGARPVLLIPAAISIAMFESEFAGIGFGLLCGLFLDIGMGGVLGFHGLLLAAACYGCLLYTSLELLIYAGIVVDGFRQIDDEADHLLCKVVPCRGLCTKDIGVRCKVGIRVVAQPLIQGQNCLLYTSRCV